MRKWKPAPVQLLIALNTMLLFFDLLEDRLSIPSWLQVAGRLHPMILHFPIVLIVLYSLCLWFAGSPTNPTGQPANPANKPANPTSHPANAADRPTTFALTFLTPFTNELLLWSAFAAVITALAGVFLSKESTYDGSAIQWHKWLGTLTSLLLLTLYLVKDTKDKGKTSQKWLSILPLATVLIAGHLGGDLTHGTGYVLAPLKALNGEKPPLDKALVYRDLIQPILATKCMTCHNSGSDKGGLNMEDPASFAKGGQSGTPWDTAAADGGILINRIHLPDDDRKHMPPIGKSQLSGDEKDLLNAWIRDGAPFSKKVIELEPTDTLRFLAGKLLKSGEDENFDFSAANEKTITKLRTNYRAITPLAAGSPALAVDFYGATFFKPEQLKELSSVKEQIVELNLERMPVTDKDLSDLTDLRNLRKLNLDFTRITGDGLKALTKLPHLQSLSLSGTQIKAADLDQLTNIKDLHKLYLWKTGITGDALADLRRKRKDLELITGFNGDTVRVRLSPPRLETEARIIRDSPVVIKMKNFMPGAVIRYTLDGSNPDSAGQTYSAPFQLKDRAQLAAKTYKPGWLASNPTAAVFYLQKYPPDSIRLLLPIDSNYMKIRPTVLIDADKGDLGFGSGKWLGFRKNGLAALFYYRKPVTIGSLTFSSIVDLGAFIFPPTDLEVWGGPNEHHLKRLGTLTPTQPDKLGPPYLTAYRIDFPPQKIGCLKVIANPIPKLPDWHPAKGQPAWIFFDELLVD